MIRLARRFLLVGAMVFGIVASAGGQTPPQPPGNDLIGAVELSSAQVQTLESWVNHWCDIMAGGSPRQVQSARQELLRPFGTPALGGMGGATLSFRAKYSQAFMPRVADLIKKGDSAECHRSTNAFRVLQEIGTEPALRTLLEHIDPQKQPDASVRKAAAAAVHGSLANTFSIPSGLSAMGKPGLLDPRKVVDAFRSIKNAVIEESDPDALNLLMGAATTAESVLLEAEARIEIRGQMVEAFASIVKRIKDEKNPPSPLMNVANAAVSSFRTAYVNISGDRRGEEQRSLGQQVGPQLGALLEAARKHWDAAQADKDENKDYANAVAMCETLLKVIDQGVRGDGKAPKSDLGQAWVDSDPAKYDADMKAWLSVVGQSPYAMNR